MNKRKNKEKGFSLVELMLIIVIIGIIAAIAIPNLLSSRRTANEGAAVSNLRTMMTAEATYKAGNPTFADLSGLNSAGLIDNTLAQSTSASNPKSGYWYSVAADATNPGIYWDATASPQIHISTSTISGTGSRHFYINESGVVYVSRTGTAPTVNSVTRVVSGGSPLN